MRFCKPYSETGKKVINLLFLVQERLFSLGVYKILYFCAAFLQVLRGSSSVDRALAFQAKGREFESRLPLKKVIRNGHFFCF